MSDDMFTKTSDICIIYNMHVLLFNSILIFCVVNYIIIYYFIIIINAIYYTPYYVYYINQYQSISTDIHRYRPIFIDIDQY